MKKLISIVSILLCVFLMISCFGGGNSPVSHEHIHKFDKTTLQCSCGIIDDGVVAYIGSSYNKATARFKTLQDAVDYLAKQQGVKSATRSISSSNTIHGYGSVISCTGITINNVEVAFDFSETTVTFTGSIGIVVNGGSVEIRGNELKSTCYCKGFNL